MDSRQDQFHDPLFEKTGENKSTERKLSTADEFKKNHILKVSPLQQIKLSTKNLADIGDLHCTDLIILSTNSDQRVHSKASFKSQAKGSFSERSPKRSRIKKGHLSPSNRHLSPNRGSDRSAKSADSDVQFNNLPITIQDQR